MRSTNCTWKWVVPVYGQMHYSYCNYLSHTPDIAAQQEPFLTSLVMTRCRRTEIQTYHLPNDEWLHYVLSHGRGFVLSPNIPAKIIHKFQWYLALNLLFRNNIKYQYTKNWTFYKRSKVFCLKLMISITTELIEFIFLGKLHLGYGMVLGNFVFIFKS